MRRRTVLLSYETTYKVLLFLYFCGLNAHNRGTGFDAIFCRGTFVALIAFELLSLVSQRKNAFLSSPFLLYLALVVFYFFTVLWARNIDDVFYIAIVFSFLQILGVIFVIEQHIDTVEDVRTCLKLMYWSIVYMAVLLLLRTPLSDWGNERVGSVMAMNANDIGIKCCIAMLLSLYFADDSKYYYILALAFSAIALFTGSRKAFMMIFMGVFLYFAARDAGMKTFRNICLGILISGIVLYIVFNNELIYKVLGYRIEAAIVQATGRKAYTASGNLVKDYSSIERKFYRKHAMEMFWDSAWIGYGANGFVTNMREIGYWHVAYSHCNYTELLATLGIAGFSIYYVPRIKLLIQSGGQVIQKHNHTILLIFVILVVTFFAEYYYVSYYSVCDQIIFALLLSLFQMTADNKSINGGN